MSKSYSSARDLKIAVAARAREQALDLGVSSGELVNRFYLQRLLTRVFHDDPDGWMLKGGQALLVRYPCARHSVDIDLLYRDQGRGLDEALLALRRAAGRDLNDHIRYEFLDATLQNQGRPSHKVRFAVHLGRKITTVSVDLVTGLAPVGEPVSRTLTAPLNIALDEQVRIQLFPLEDHIADKVCAMYERHNGRVSTRVKDLVDLIVIASREHVHGHRTHRALQLESDRRRKTGTDLTFPPRFAVPEPHSWNRGYNREARTITDLDRYRTLEQATPIADAFISPLLSETAPRHWSPESLSWNSPGGGFDPNRP